MKKLIALGTSNSKNSINKTLAVYAANQINNVEVDIVDLSSYELPLYGIDFEEENGIPENGIKLNNRIASADGFVISLTEHNGSYSAFFKNTLDWLSRIDIKIWKNKPVFLLATSPGPRGASIVLQSAKNYFPYLGGNIITDFSLPSFFDNFHENDISNIELKETLHQKIQFFEQEMNNA